ncbi:MAG: alginate lyase family protein [Lewinella sp.]
MTYPHSLSSLRARFRFSILWQFGTVSWICLLSVMGCAPASAPSAESQSEVDASLTSRASTVAMADSFLQREPIPITREVSPRSTGGPRDFYSEGDYWWPDPENPDGPYVRRDGETNPDNFVAHRRAMVDLSKAVAALVAAYVETGEERYAEHAMRFLRTWFVDPETSMTPHLLYAQAIKGRVTGRGIGIIDTIHLIEVAKAVGVLREMGYLEGDDRSAVVGWFEDYLNWMASHPYGHDERDHGNNHSTWYAAQVAAFANLTGNDAQLDSTRMLFKRMLDEQMNEEGGFTDELSRTKPYIYSLFILEGYSVLAEYASTPDDNLWTYEGSQGSLRDGWSFMMPYIRDKAGWPYPPDVMHYDEVPIQSVGLLLAARAYDDAEMLRIWQSLDPTQRSAEIARNFPLRQPVLWGEPG